MILSTQIKSFIISFIYGIIYAALFNLNYKVLFFNKKSLIILTNIFFNFDIFLLYFLLLKMINNGVVHIYFLMLLLLGFVVGNKSTKKLR